MDLPIDKYFFEIQEHPAGFSQILAPGIKRYRSKSVTHVVFDIIFCQMNSTSGFENTRNIPSAFRVHRLRKQQAR